MTKEELQSVLWPLGCWSKFLHNLDTVRRAVDLDYLLKRRSLVSDILSGAFTWGDTPEGFDYWKDIYNRFEARGL